MQQHFPLCAEINPQTGRLWHWFTISQQHFIPKKPRFISSDSYSNLALILAGEAIGMLPDYLYRHHLQQGNLVTLFPELPIPEWKMFLYRPYQENTPIRVERVFELLCHILPEHYAIT